MKFGKRVASEAARSSHQTHFLDYKACKRAIQQDVLANGAFSTQPPFFVCLQASIQCDDLCQECQTEAHTHLSVQI